MKKASNIISWIGGAITTVWNFVVVALGFDVAVKDIFGRTTMQHVPSPWWLWGLVIIGTIIRLVILLCRSSQLEEGSKIGIGILTLIFVSIVGGILTLCIPEEELHPRLYRTKAKPSQSSYHYGSTISSKPVDQPEPIEEPTQHFNEGDRVRVVMDPIKTPDGEIPVGSIGVVTVPNSRGEPEVTFEELGIKVRVQERYLRKAEEE